MMSEIFASYELALLAKTKGFDRTCCRHYRKGKVKNNYIEGVACVDFGDVVFSNTTMPEHYDADCATPTLSLLQCWLRDSKGVEVSVNHLGKDYSHIITDCEGYLLDYSCLKFSNYYRALEEGLRCALENLI